MNMAVTDALAALPGHSLADQLAVELMNRVDTKFLVPEPVLETCLGKVADHYSVLELSGQRRLPYDTLYFDTPDRRFYRDHHNGKLNRYKVRLRHYRHSGASFLEVKKKTNRLRTVKTRTPVVPGETVWPELAEFLQRCSGQPVAWMRPALFVHYRRATLIDAAGTERITLDTRLSFASADHQQTLHLPGFVIVEVKTGQRSESSRLRDQLQAMGCRPVSFSKYCIGSSLLFGDALKTNRFKPLLRSLYGICH